MPAGRMSLAPGTEIAGYRIESELGRGGMGAVYVATHLTLERRDALKILMPELAEDASFRERFIRESQLAARLDHPNIIPIYDADKDGGYLFIAMRYVEGSDLKGLLDRKGTLSPDEALPIVEQAASALDAAHVAGLVHRDVKPANILLEQKTGRVYLTDFGIAKTAGAAGLTRTGSFVGTVDYCAPEQIEGKPVDGRTDVYALGCVLYQCLTGQPPYPKDTDVAVIHAHLADPPPAVTTKKPELPEALDGVIVTAMAKYPDVRFPTCAALADALRAALGGAPAKPTPTRAVPMPTAAAPPLAAPSTPPPSLPRTDETVVPGAPRRPRWHWVAGGLAALAVLGGIATGLALALGGGSGGSTTTGPIVTPLAEAEGIVSPLVAVQNVVSARVTALEADTASFDRLRSASVALERAALRAEEQAAGISVSAEQESQKAALRGALGGHRAYAQLLARLPAPAQFSVDYATGIVNLADATEQSYASLRRLGTPVPEVGLTRASSEHLLDVARDTEAPTTAAQVRRFAGDVQALLVRSSQARSELRVVLDAANRCTISYREAADRVQEVATLRQELVADVGDLEAPTAATRGVSRLLGTALNNSLASNLAYRDWLLALDVRTSCRPGNPPANADLAAAQRADARATASKQAFLRIYNPLARRVGFRPWKVTEI